MKTLELECPSCGEMLELDAGFAGGVCRCSSCGTLMTVPSDAGPAESLSKPSPAPAADFAEDSFSESVAPPPRRSSAGSRGKSKSRRSSSTIEAGEYVTESGKVVKLDKPVRVPMATKRKRARIATIVVFFSLIGVFVIAGIIAVVLMMGGGPNAGSDSASSAYDPSANPFDLLYANVAGLPLKGDVAVVVESSERSADWILEVADVVGVGLTRPKRGVTVSLYGSDSGVKPIEGTKLGGLDAGDVADWFEGLPDTGDADLSTAIKKAVDAEVDQLILIVGGASAEEVASWKAAVGSGESADEINVHIVLLSGSPADARRWLNTREDSVLANLSAQDIENFRFIAETLKD